MREINKRGMRKVKKKREGKEKGEMREIKGGGR